MAEKFNWQILLPIQLGDAIIQAFQTKSIEAYRRLAITKTEYSELFENDFEPKLEQRNFSVRKKNILRDTDFYDLQQFDRLLAKGSTLGIDWSQITKGEFIFEENSPANSTQKVLVGYLNFLYKSETYVFFGIEAIQFSLGYKIAVIRTVLKGGIDEYLDPDLLDDEDL